MKQRVITGAIFTVVVLALVVPAYFYPVTVLLFTAIVTCFAIYELVKAVKLKAKDISPVTIPALYCGRHTTISIG